MDILIIFTIYLSFILQPTYGFEVIQPHNRTINPDGMASISCGHNADVESVEDVRLYAISQTEKPRCVCQKGQKHCEDVIMYEDKPNKWLFILLNVKAENMAQTYQCEFTVKQGELDNRKKGVPTVLLPGEKKVACVAPPPPVQEPRQLIWKQLDFILIGLLALMFLYSCVITFICIREKCSKSEPENSTYVEMRKAPPRRHPSLDIY